MNKSKNNGNFIRTALRLAVPIAFQNLLTSCATLVDTAMVVGLGNDATSAMGVASRFSFLLNVICFGFASGCSALLSQYWGAGDRVNIRRSTGFAITVAMSFGIIYTAALLVFPNALASIFTDNETIITLAGEYLSTFAFAVPFLVFSQIMCIALRSVECVMIPLVSSFVSVGVNIFFNYCFIGGNLGFPSLRSLRCGNRFGSRLCRTNGCYPYFRLCCKNSVQRRFPRLFFVLASVCQKVFRHRRARVVERNYVGDRHKYICYGNCASGRGKSCGIYPV